MVLAGLYEDAEAVLEALATKGVGPERIALFGESSGTGVAVEMAARGRGSSVVLVTPYTSIPEVASRFVLGLPAWVLMSERFDSLAKSARVTIPAVVLHGTHDGVVPYAMGMTLAKLCHGRGSSRSRAGTTTTSSSVSDGDSSTKSSISFGVLTSEGVPACSGARS